MPIFPVYTYDEDGDGPWCRVDTDAAVTYYIAFSPDFMQCVYCNIWGVYGE